MTKKRHYKRPIIETQITSSQEIRDLENVGQSECKMNTEVGFDDIKDLPAIYVKQQGEIVL